MTSIKANAQNENTRWLQQKSAGYRRYTVTAENRAMKSKLDSALSFSVSGPTAIITISQELDETELAYLGKTTSPVYAAILRSALEGGSSDYSLAWETPAAGQSSGANQPAGFRLDAD